MLEVTPGIEQTLQNDQQKLSGIIAARLLIQDASDTFAVAPEGYLFEITPTTRFSLVRVYNMQWWEGLEAGEPAYAPQINFSLRSGLVTAWENVPEGLTGRRQDTAEIQIRRPEFTLGAISVEAYTELVEAERKRIRRSHAVADGIRTANS